jgi:phosphoenolpyruvate carboxylase
MQQFGTVLNIVVQTMASFLTLLPCSLYPQGKLRVTIQGETIEQQFGEREVCFRTLDLYTSAVLEACLDPPSAALPEWRELMNQLSETSCKVREQLTTRPAALVGMSS